MFISYYKRNLPHLFAPSSRYFITFRLANSLPKNVVENLKNEYDEIKSNIIKADTIAKINAQRQYFEKFDQILDVFSEGDRWLSRPAIADGVAQTIHFLDGQSYDLICFTIMPNHVHMLFDHSFDYSGKSVADVLQSLKKYTARISNKTLDRSGNQFWQHESYDHIVKDDRETENVIRYILYNPVKAGLCNEWKEWRWSYVKEDFRGFFQ